MVISVKGAGETCADPDRYLQIISGKTLASFGVSQRTDLIVRPNYPLLVSMVLITIFGLILTLWMFHYCMHKGWDIQEMTDDSNRYGKFCRSRRATRKDAQSYRDSQLMVNIHHENDRVFVGKNDFVQHRSE